LREEFYDFDLLFQGYAMYWLDFKRSKEIFDEVVRRHPTWGVARVYRASALTLLADNEFRLDYLDDAVKEIGIARPLVKENAWTLLERLFIHLKVIKLHAIHGLPAEESEEARREGRILAERLYRDYPENTVGVSLAARYYDAVGEEETAEKVYDLLMTRDADLYTHDAIGYYYGRHTSEETIRKIEGLGSDASLVLAAKAYALADVPGGRERALEISETLLSRHSSAWMRYKAVQILLLLGETDKARARCQEWAREPGDTSGPRLSSGT
jgi:tetratricopeptide (TPR) repeat protein